MAPVADFDPQGVQIDDRVVAFQGAVRNRPMKAALFGFSTALECVLMYVLKDVGKDSDVGSYGDTDGC